jgi:2-amino-4-hydroxy-6-hydroxymethyldihydropteridine diphosphokinase
MDKGMHNWRYLIAFGSNRGDRQANIRQAGDLIAQDIGVIERTSAISQTAPVGGPAGQHNFLNGCWIVRSGYGPHQVLMALQRIETLCGRVRTIPWGPRTIDLDIILREDGLTVSSPILQLPHPRAHERDFVRLPVLSIANEWPAVRRLFAE